MTSKSLAFETAVGLQKAGQVDEAAEIYENILSEEPGSDESRFNLAVIRTSQGALEEAVAHYQILLEKSPDDASILTNYGNLYLKQGRHAEAQDIFRRSIIHDASSPEAHLGLGNARLSLGDLDGAEHSFNTALSHREDQAATHNNLGVVYMAQGRSVEAKACFERSLELDPLAADAHNNYATILCNNDAYEAALPHFDAAANLSTEWAQPRINHAAALSKLGRLKDAAISYRLALALNPRDLRVLRDLAGVLIDQKDDTGAEELLNSCREISPGDPNTPYLFGNLMALRRDFKKALAEYQEALSKGGDFSDLHVNCGDALLQLRRYDEAFEISEMAITRWPDSSASWILLGSCHFSQGRMDEAISAFEKSARLEPDNAQVQVNLASSMLKKGDVAGALERARANVTNFSDDSSAHSTLGLVFHSMEKYDDAITEFDRALKIDPKNFDALHNKAATIQRLGRNEEAVALYMKALKVDPRQEKSYFNLATLMQGMNNHREAMGSLNKALEIRPDYLSALAYLAHSMMHECMWENLGSVREAIIDGTRQEIVARSEIAASPFSLLAITAPGDVRLAAARHVCNSISRTVSTMRDSLDFTYPTEAGERLRIGYISPDFRQHSASRAFTEVLTSHDRNRFEVFGYSTATGRDQLTNFFAENFDHFVDLSSMPYDEAAKAINHDQIHILIDLAGHTRGVRFEVLALQPAPIQIHFLGYARTIGANFVQYLVTDDIVTPPEDVAFCSEKLIYLPYNSLPASKQQVTPYEFSRHDAGLPDEGFVFACFNSHFKIDPEIFSTWMRILRQVDGSVLWLLNTSASSADNLRAAAKQSGVADDRLIFAPHATHADHLARLSLADLCLDTKNHAGGVTSTDALWAGVPVMTLREKSMIDHMGASLLSAVELPELIADGIDDYTTRCTRLALEPERLADLRQRLEAARDTAPLFNTKRFTEYLETAYLEVWARQANGQQPDHITVEADAQRQREAV